MEKTSKLLIVKFTSPSN